MTIKINRRDDTFAKLVAEAKEAPGFSYAKSRNREYKGFNDDFQAEKLLKNEEIQQAVSIYKKHIIAADVVGRQEALIDLSGRFRAPDAAEVMLELLALEKLRLETASKAAGGTQQLTPTITPSGATNKTVTYQTSNANVATVDAAGLVTVKAGTTTGQTATITVRTEDGGFTDTAVITVS